MAQSVNLSVSGIYTSMSDYNGLPQGALDEAIDVVSRYKNTLEPRRGFQGLVDSPVDFEFWKRLINFYVGGFDRILGLLTNGTVYYYDATMIPAPWIQVPGNATGIINPNDLNGKSRFIRAGQNLYLTSQDGVRSLSSGTNAMMIRAGVPKALNLEAEANGDNQGFFDPNTVLSTTGDLTSGGAIILNLLSSDGLAVGQYVGGEEVIATKVVQDLTYSSELFGAAGNAITIAYTTGGVAGSEVVSVVGNAVSVQIQSGVSTATQIRTAVLASAPATALVDVVVSGTGSNTQTAPVAPTALTGGLDSTVPLGTKILTITPEAPVIIQDGDTTAGDVTISNLTSNAGIIPGLIVQGAGIPDGAKIISVAGGGPYTVDLDLAAFATDTGIPITFISPITVTMDQNALVTANGTTLNFYSGAQVGYRMLFGRVETDINGGTITRLGAPSAIGIATNLYPYSTNVTVVGTLPKNAQDEITFVQLYRSDQTDAADITPLDQYLLVYERALTPADFTARVITIEDNTPDSLRGIPLYAGSDREGILQANNPPPMCWDMCTFRTFAIYANITQPSTLDFTILAVGSPNGVQVGDEITVSGTYLGDAYSETYVASLAEDAANREFQVFTSGTPAQNVTDTANSLIRVINYDEDVPVHAILLSTTSDLPGQILLEADDPSYDTFQITADLHQDAYDPELNDLTSDVNTIGNGLGISKQGEIEAVPAANLLRAGDSSSYVLRVVPLRDYVFVLKTDGIYKLQGLTPNTLVVSPFDLTTKIIGADTAVALNSAVWMFSNQGVVSVSDGGVDAKSIPIDDQLNLLIGSYIDNVTDVSFGIGYESDREYILAVPDGNNPFAETEFVFNYVTSSWTKWDRNIHTGFIHSNEGSLYISRADEDNEGVSRERKSATYRDYVDEGTVNSIVAINDYEIELASVTDVLVGDILFQSESIFSPILEVDLATNRVTVQTAVGWVVGSVEVLHAYETKVTWKQVFGDNPAFVRQFSEGLLLFKNTRFNTASMSFKTDFSQSTDTVEVLGTGNGLWGLFPWGSLPWGAQTIPTTIRFYIPQNKQLGSYLLPTLNIRQGYSNFKFQGLAIYYSNVNFEVGR